MHIYGSGTGNYKNTAIVTSAGELLVRSTEAPPINSTNALTQLLYVISGTSTGVTGSEIGSIIKFIGTGSYVQVITYSGNQITQIGSWV